MSFSSTYKLDRDNIEDTPLLSSKNTAELLYTKTSVNLGKQESAAFQWPLVFSCHHIWDANIIKETWQRIAPKKTSTLSNKEI